MTTPQNPRWYCVNNMGMATLCADKADAEDVARTCDMEWPRQGPHRAVQLVEVSALDTERTARIAAQVENEALKAERARSGLAHRKAVKEAVREALHEAQKACENLPAPDSCSGVERSLWDVATMACAEAVCNSEAEGSRERAGEFVP